jgi:hypothetical protein
MMHPLDAWHKSLVLKMRVGGNTGARHDCHEGVDEWDPSELSHFFVGYRLFLPIFPSFRHALLKITNGTNNGFVSVTTITALLALHIESALDPAETDLIRSMARISISQTMLVLTQGKEIPVLKRALPVFEDTLTKKGLYSLPPNSLGQVSVQSHPQDNRVADPHSSPHSEVNVVSSQLEQCENNPSFDVDFLGFDFLDEWQIGQLDSTGQY